MTIINTLSNGIKVVFEEIPYVRSISLGIWVKNGSANESSQLSGISHYIEHMIFKGTKKRSAKDIAEEMDAVGGQINAYTTKEYTCYHTRSLDKHFDIALDVIIDMFLNSKFDDDDIKKERNVILEEINMYEDAPEEIVHEILQQEVWKDDSLGMAILGSEESISTFNHAILKDYWEKNYRTDNTVISITGNFITSEILAKLENVFKDYNCSEKLKDEERKIKYYPSITVKKKETEQIHVVIGFPCIKRDDDRKYAYTVFNTIFGGGMSSFLFQKIREDNGLTYSVYSYISQYTNTGLFSIYAGMNPVQTEKVLNLVFGEIELIRKNGIDEKILAKTKEQIISNFIIGNESTVNKMTSNGGAVLFRGEVRTQEETIEKIEKVTMDDINDTINQIFDYKNISIAAVGKVEGIDFQKIIAKTLNE